MQLQQKGHFWESKKSSRFHSHFNRVFGVTTTRAQQFRIKFYLVKFGEIFQLALS